MLGEPTAGHAVVVYESMFGNTETVARAVAEALATRFGTVEVVAVADAPTEFDDVDLLVVGAPTHAFGLSRPQTRESAVAQGATGATARGVRDWIADVTRPATPTAAACFDTRIRKPYLVGSAARGLRRRLRRLGFAVVPPVSFAVSSTAGPLADGELDRARRWAAGLVPPVRRSRTAAS